MSKEDLAWSQFEKVVKGYIPSQQDIIEAKWAAMAQQSALKTRLLQKQHNLKARMRAL